MKTKIPNLVKMSFCKISFVNFRSVLKLKQQNKLKIALKNTDSEIFAITETWLNGDKFVKGDPVLPDYYFASKCSRVGKGGGVAVLAKKGLIVENITDGLPPSDVGIQYCKIKFAGNILIFIYREPRASQEETDNMFEFIKNESKNAIIMGDLNIPEVNWHILSWPPRLNTNMSKIIDSNLHQVVDTPTRGGNILDLILVRDPERINNLEIINSTDFNGGSDHALLMFELKIKDKIREKKVIYVDDYSKANFTLYRELLKGMTIAKQYYWFDLEKKCQSLIDDMKLAWSLSVPKKKVIIGKNPFNFESRETKQVGTRLRRLCRLRMKMKNESQYLNSEIKELSKYFRKMRRRDHAREEQRIFGGDLQGKVHVAKHLEKFNQAPRLKPGPLNVGGKAITEDVDVANEFKETFIQNYTSLEIPDLNQSYPNNVTKMREIKFNYRLIKGQMKTMKRRTADGLDGIKVQMVLESGDVLLDRLCDLFQCSYDQRKIPSQWYTSVVSPIFKKGKRDDPKNYRPVSVASNLHKLMEKCIMICVNKHLNKFGLWTPVQYAYRPKMSVTTNLMDHNRKLEKIIYNRGCVTCAYFDASAAFETVSYANIVRGLFRVGLPIGLIHWFYDMLINRKFCVRIGDAFSAYGYPSSGSPQGGVASAYLYTLSTNDAKCVIPDEYKDIAHLKLYSDDTMLMVDTTTPRGIDAMRKILKNLEVWFKERTIKINPKKCAKMTYGAAQPNIDYYINDQIIEQKKIVRDLGTHYHSSRKFNYEYEKIIRTVRSIVYKIRRVIVTKDIRILSNIWKCFILCHLTNCVLVIGRPNATQLAKLQQLQRLFFLGSQSCTTCKKQKEKRRKGDFSQCLIHIGVDPLEIHFLKFELRTVHSILSEKMIVREDILIRPRRESITRLNMDNGLLPPARTILDSDHCFSQRSHVTWNKLGKDQKCGLKKHEFIKALDNEVPFLNWKGAYGYSFSHKSWDRKAQLRRLRILNDTYRIKFHS